MSKMELAALHADGPRWHGVTKSMGVAECGEDAGGGFMEECRLALL